MLTKLSSKEVRALITYFITRGECRENFYDNPADAEALAAAANAKEEASEVGSMQVRNNLPFILFLSFF